MDFREIYDLYSDPVRAFIARLVGDEWAADDLTQETFMRVQRNLQDLRDHSKLRPWIFRIARNVCLDYFRSRAARDNFTQEMTYASVDTMEPPAQLQIQQNQMSQCVQEKTAKKKLLRGSRAA